MNLSHRIGPPQSVKRSIGLLSVAIPFFYKDSRLTYLQNTLGALPDLAEDVDVNLFTNAQSHQEVSRIQSSAPPGMTLHIHRPSLLGHPYLLTWSHFPIFRHQLETREDITHFLYLEDDIVLRSANVDYWLNARELLRGEGLIPSFIRYETDETGSNMFATDVTKSYKLSSLPRLRKPDGTAFCNLPQNYQGLYLLDRELAKEHFYGPTSSPDHVVGGIRETAALGVTFLNVPQGCYSRNFIGINVGSKQIEEGCLVHHAPGNYTNDYSVGFGKIEINRVIRFDSCKFFEGGISLPLKVKFKIATGFFRHKSVLR